MNRSSEFSLTPSLDEATGQLLGLTDPQSGRPILRFERAPELAINQRPLQTSVIETDAAPGEHLTCLRARLTQGYGTAADLHIRRVISRGMHGLRPGHPQSIHIRYELTRVPIQEKASGLDFTWQLPIEAPLRIDDITVLGAPTPWFGDHTRMRALAIGGTGPREHVSYEDGPVAEVAPWLATGFRSELPGQCTAAGALYYDPQTEDWVWMLVRRPTTTGRCLIDADRHAYRFGYHLNLGIQDELFTPAVSYFWGQGLHEAERRLAEQFDLYQEPPDWAWRTVWFWLHPPWTHGIDFNGAAEGAKLLMDTCGVNGFGLMVHDVPASGNDVDINSPAPIPALGGDQGIRRLTRTIRDRGGHSYAWISRHGHRPDTLPYQPSWAIQGIDGRPIRLRNRPDRGVNLDILNPADPDFLRYMQEWVRYYVEQLAIDGLFWDSGFQPLPPDFGDKPYLRWPGQTNAMAALFYEKMLRFGQSLSPDFFMWAEGISLDIPMNCFSVDARAHGPHSAHRLMHRLAHLGPKRLMWRSAWPHDLASGFVMLDPPNDVGQGQALYQTIADDPANQWVCRIVRERGVRHAVGLAEGVSRLDEFVVVSPGRRSQEEADGPRRAACPEVVTRVPDAPSPRLRNLITHTTVEGTPDEGGTAFKLTEAGPYEFA